MPTARGRVRREDAARIRIENAQNIIRDALGVPLPSFEEPRTRDAETRRMFMLENLAGWMEALAAALQDTPPQEVNVMAVEGPNFLYQGDETIAPEEWVVSTNDPRFTEPMVKELLTQEKTAYPIKDMDMGDRVKTILTEAGIEWDWQIPHDDRNLQDIAGIGPAAVEEIRAAQAKLTDDTTD